MVQVHSGPSFGVIAQLVERQLCKLDVRSSSLLSSRGAPGRKTVTLRGAADIEIAAVKRTKESNQARVTRKHRRDGGFELLMRQNKSLIAGNRKLCERMHAGDA